MAPSQHSYIPQIDSLRAFAVIAVLVFHLNAGWLPGGFAGVDVFFVISGYVVSASLIRSRASGFRQFALGFYAKRILRIVPALLVCMLVTALLTIFFIPDSWLSQSNYTTLLLALVGLSNFSLMSTGDSYFSPRIDFNPGTHTWSLGVEEQFYFIFPAIYFLWLRGQQRNASSRLATWALPLAVAVSFAYSTYASVNTPLYAYYSLPSRFWELGFGALLFQLHHSGRFISGAGARWNFSLLVAFLLLIVAIVFSSGTSFPVPWGLAATVGSVLFIDAVVARARDASSSAMRMLGAAALVGIGKISYSLYLWHWPVYVLFRWTIGLEQTLHQIVAVTLVFALAIASYRYLEVPIRHNPAILRWPSGSIVAGGIATVVMSMTLTLGALQARPQLTLSVTGNTHDWYSTPWPIEESGASAACHVAANWRALGGGGVHEFVHRGCTTPARDVRKLFVIGDSHAGALMTMLSKFALSERTDVYLYNRAGCSFLRLSEPSVAPHCLQFATAFTEELRDKARPGDSVLLPSLRVERIADQWGGVTKREMRSPEALQERRARGLLEAEEWLERIAPLELRVVFMGPTPVFAAPAFRCADWFNRDNPICRPGLAIQRQTMEDLREPALEGMRRLAQRHSNVSIWDPFEVLCSDTSCAAMRDGRPIFFDGDHLSSFGNLLIYDSFRDSLSPTPLNASSRPLSGHTSIASRPQ
jgi:peptidoglycan/LPS O-acetylase OafA/YrhL